ncbi:MAG: MFS transporter [Thermodesulfobacteriota bacterium]
MKEPGKAKAANPFLWSFTTYFSEGFPYSIFRTLSAIFFRDRGMSLEGIGLTSIFALPWVVKFLWSPQLDEFGTKRQWLLITQGLLVLFVLAAAVVSPLPWAIPAVVLLFFCGSCVAATHDIAIDGYYMEALDVAGQARFLGYRVMAYRVAMLTGTGLIATLAALTSWTLAFGAAGLLLAAFFLFHLRYLPHCEKVRRPLGDLAPTLLTPRNLGLVGAAALALIGLRTGLESTTYRELQESAPLFRHLTFAAWIGLLLLLGLVALLLRRRQLHRWILARPESFYASAFISFMDGERTGTVLAFIVLIRTGEFLLSAMTGPFLIDLGLKLHYGWISGSGLLLSIGGAMAGGTLIARHGLRKMIWPFLLAQNGTNLVYMALALHLRGALLMNTGSSLPLPLATPDLLLVVGVHAFDQFAGGLGTAVLMTYLMRICRQEFKAAHYAIGSGLMSMSGLYAGILSGFLAAWLGYARFFGLSFLLSLPGMALVFLLPHLDRR